MLKSLAHINLKLTEIYCIIVLGLQGFSMSHVNNPCNILRLLFL